VFRLLRFVIFFLALASLLVFLVLPAVISPLLTQFVRDMGVKADSLSVSVDTFDPSLLSGRASRLRVQGQNVEIGRAQVGQLDLTFGDVSFFDRSFGSLDGQMDDVAVGASGLSARAQQVDVSGPAGDATAIGKFDSQQSEDLVKAAAQRAGLPLDRAQLIAGGLRLTSHGLSIDAGISVDGGALVLTPTVGDPILLLQPATSDPWRLDEAFVSPSGITVRGTVDATKLAKAVVAHQP
jgi:hypothetical protein